MGLLLEDGGSWSDLRRQEDLYLEKGTTLGILVKSNIAFSSTRYETQLAGVKALTRHLENITHRTISVAGTALLLSSLQKRSDGTWKIGIDSEALMSGDGTAFEKRTPSRLPIMERSQQMMMPTVIFRNLHVPMHIIDPVSENDGFPVSYQNQILQEQHSDLIVHEIYENTPHLAHFKRPGRFIESAKALLNRVNTTGRSVPKQ